MSLFKITEKFDENIDAISYSKLIENGYKYINNNKSLF